MRKTYIFLLFAVLSFPLAAQVPADEVTDNIVPNPGFERFSSNPIGWFYKGEHFTKVMKYWSSPTGASPDVFGPKVRVPASWAEKDFGKETPHNGGAMVGITVYGCVDGKPHCREYVQAQLAEPLVVGQDYYVEMWVNQLPRSLDVNNLGFHFSPTKVDITTDELLPLPPQVRSEEIVEVAKGRWQRVSGTFTAEAEAEYLLIGNFFDDDHTRVAGMDDEHLKYAYYYLDDVLVKKIPPILPVPVKPDDLTKIELEEGKIVRLKHLYFEFDKYELHPRSYVELRKLVSLMKANPSMVIQVNGHTDNKGADNYNMYLSRKRAKAVVYYLNEQGIPRERTLYKGFGHTQPIASNDTSEGRQLNRRVEFLIVRQ